METVIYNLNHCTRSRCVYYIRICTYTLDFNTAEIIYQLLFMLLVYKLAVNVIKRILLMYVVVESIAALEMRTFCLQPSSFGAENSVQL